MTDFAAVCRALLAAAGILYLFCLRAYYVGFFNDDAFFLIGAESLRDGAYAQLQAPGAPPLIQYLPGYPLLLAPVLLLSGGSRLAAAAFGGLMLWTAWRLLPRAWGEELPAEAAWAAALLCAFNPLSLSLAGTLLSDAPFTLWTVLILWRARAFWNSAAPRNWAVLGAMAAFAFLLRPTGMAFVLVVPLLLALEDRPRAAGYFLAAAAPLSAAFPLRNLLVSGAALPYAAELADPYAVGRGGAALYNLWYYASELYARTLLRWPFAGMRLPATLTAMAAGAALTLLGLARWQGAGWRRFALAYAAASAVVLLGWSKTSGRYLLPLLPLVVPWLAYAVWRLGRERTGPRRLAALLALSALCTAPTAARIVRASWTRSGPMAEIPAVYPWLAANTPADAVVAADLDGRLFELTRRRAVRPPAAATTAELRHWARRSGVDFILVRPEPFLMQARGGSGAHDGRGERLAALAGGSADFARVYADGESAVYARSAK